MRNCESWLANAVHHYNMGDWPTAFASKLAPTAFGQNQMLKPHRYLASARRAWEPDLSAICRVPAVRSSTSVHQAHRMRKFCCRCAPDRRQGGAPPRWLPRPSGRSRSVCLPASLQRVAYRASVLSPKHLKSALARAGPHGFRPESKARTTLQSRFCRRRGSQTCRRSAGHRQ